MLRPLGLVVIAAVAIGVINGHPAPAGHGKGLGVAAALVGFAVLLAVAVSLGPLVGAAIAGATTIGLALAEALNG